MFKPGDKLLCKHDRESCDLIKDKIYICEKFYGVTGSHIWVKGILFPVHVSNFVPLIEKTSKLPNFL